MSNLQAIFQQSEAAIDQHLLSASAPHAVDAGLTGEALKVFNICAAYQKVKPIFGFITWLLGIFKPSWVPYVNEFTALLDGLCPPPVV